MLPVSWDTIRVFTHVTAATVWVGGQLTLAGLVPGLRALSPDAPKAVARRFNRIAWPAYGVLIATGIWNIVELAPTWDSDYGRTLMLKIAVVAASGTSALAHSRARTPRGLAAFGAVSGVTALAALFLGTQLG
jgi:putative copper export protein